MFIFVAVNAVFNFYYTNIIYYFNVINYYDINNDENFIVFVHRVNFKFHASSFKNYRV